MGFDDLDVSALLFVRSVPLNFVLTLSLLVLVIMVWLSLFGFSNIGAYPGILTSVQSCRSYQRKVYLKLMQISFSLSYMSWYEMVLGFKQPFSRGLPSFAFPYSLSGLGLIGSC